MLELHPIPTFQRKAVMQMWREDTQTAWKRDDDEVKSARILLEEAAKRSEDDKKRGLYSISQIDLPQEDGFTALAFTLPDLLNDWGGVIRELQLDSACKCVIL